MIRSTTDWWGAEAADEVRVTCTDLYRLHPPPRHRLRVVCRSAAARSRRSMDSLHCWLSWESRWSDNRNTMPSWMDRDAMQDMLRRLPFVLCGLFLPARAWRSDALGVDPLPTSSPAAAALSPAHQLQHRHARPVQAGSQRGGGTEQRGDRAAIRRSELVHRGTQRLQRHGYVCLRAAGSIRVRPNNTQAQSRYSPS